VLASTPVLVEQKVVPIKALTSEDETNVKSLGQIVIHKKIVELLQRLKAETDLNQINKIVEAIENLRRLSSTSFE
jgi:hypothetical protein